MARQKFSESIEIPKGITCTFNQDTLKCKKDNMEISRKMDIPLISIKVEENIIKIVSKSSNRIEVKKIRTLLAHIRNIFHGLNEKFVYNLGIASVHFPITTKVEGSDIVINNFLGEKVPRKAKIMPNVDVEIKGQEITISSFDREAAGQTAANLEKATRTKNKDRRIFQDGIYITSKPSTKGEVKHA